MRTRIALTVAVSALAFVAVGCGGSDSEADDDPTAAWASDFCNAITTWTDELETVTSQFSDTSNLSQDGLQSAADDVKGATDELVDDLRALGAPETEGGEEIRSSLDSLSTTLETEAATIEETAQGISGLTGIPSAITAVTSSLSAMGTAFAATLEAIESADVRSELQDALSDSPECAGITS
jgi:methyl-accepting chemotaxis protein